MIRQTTEVADEVWIAVALLHRENPKREDFTVTEIVERARREKIAGGLRPGFQVHVYLHCVANRPAQPWLLSDALCHRQKYSPPVSGKYDFDPKRRRGKVKPEKENIPARYQPLLDWYSDKFFAKRKGSKETDPILGLLGLGKEIGLARTRMTMSAVFAEDGSGPDFLGHEFVHLFDRGSRESVGAGD